MNSKYTSPQFRYTKLLFFKAVSNHLIAIFSVDKMTSPSTTLLPKNINTTNSFIITVFISSFKFYIQPKLDAVIWVWVGLNHQSDRLPPPPNIQASADQCQQHTRESRMSVSLCNTVASLSLTSVSMTVAIVKYATGEKMHWWRCLYCRRPEVVPVAHISILSTSTKVAL